MAINQQAFQAIKQQLGKASLVAVSKTKPASDISDLYALGQRHFGENYVQELVEKQAALPADIHWHFIGHLQSNKVKYIAPFVTLIHGVDSEKLLMEIQKQGAKLNKKIAVLLQVHIAQEETKFGFDGVELGDLFKKSLVTLYPNISVVGFMGMASFTENKEQISLEFAGLQQLFYQYHTQFSVHGTVFDEPQLSMGMSGDYEIATRYGATLVRIGSLLFGARNYNK